MKSIIPILFLASAALTTACLEEPDCFSKTTNFANIKFYKSSNNEEDTLLINSLTIMDSDSILVTDKEVKSVKLPLRPDQLKSTFYFDTELGLDTLILTYKTNSRMVSEDCGVEIVYSELGYEGNAFDSIKVVNRILVEEITEDVKIYN